MPLSEKVDCSFRCARNGSVTFLHSALGLLIPLVRAIVRKHSIRPQRCPSVATASWYAASTCARRKTCANQQEVDAFLAKFVRCLIPIRLLGIA